MAKQEVLAGQTDYTVLVFIPDSASTDGSGKTGLVAANLTVSYVRVETDNDVTVTDVTSSLNNLALLTTVHTDWGLLEVSNTLAPGLYRLDIADAVFATGAWSAVVYVMVTTSAAAASPMEFMLVPNSPLTGVLLAPTQAATTFAALTVTGMLEVNDGVDIAASTTNRAGVAVAGNGTAPGVYVTGGATGDGVRAESGTGGTGKAGVNAVGLGTGGIGLKATGAGTGAGFSSTGGADGAGILAQGGATSGNGLKAVAGGGGVGIEAGGTGADGHGISAHGAGGVSAHGIQAVSGTGLLGHGIHALGSGTTGSGLSLQGSGGANEDLLLNTPSTNLDDATLAAIAALQTLVEDIPTSAESAEIADITDAMDAIWGTAWVSAGTCAALITTLSTKVLKYFQLLFRKDAAIATDNADEVVEINADEGSGPGTFDNTTDSQEALADTGGGGPTADQIADEVETRTLILHADYDAAKTAASQTSVNTIDGIVDDILVDTGTTLQAELDDIQARLPAALTGDGLMQVDIIRIDGEAAAVWKE